MSGFSEATGTSEMKGASETAERLLQLETELCSALEERSFAGISHIYNPLLYAVDPHAAFIRRYCRGTKRVLLLGMNPGPFGMAQTGVPFGQVQLVRDWLLIHGPVRQPGRLHPKRPILGFDCTRSEVSGSRLWGLVQELCGSEGPDRFFAHCFVHNYCPLVFMTGPSGRNVTPPSLTCKAELRELEAACDGHLRRVAALLQPELVVGVGVYATERARKALAEDRCRVECLPHPSPINPAANRPPGWAANAVRKLHDIGFFPLANISQPTV